LLALPASVRVFFATAPCDMRRGFDMLEAMVRESFGDDPLSGHLFVFRSRRGDRLKILWWDRDGYVLWYKRLEKGTFRMAANSAPAGSARIELDRRTLTMLLEGIEPANVKKTRRFSMNPLALSAACVNVRAS
jgi:transposase